MTREPVVIAHAILMAVTVAAWLLGCTGGQITTVLALATPPVTLITRSLVTPVKEK